MELVEIRDERDVPLIRVFQEDGGQVGLEGPHDVLVLAPEQAEELSQALLAAVKAARELAQADDA